MTDTESGMQPQAGSIMSYQEICEYEGTRLQRGMNFHLHGGHSVVLMSLRAGAPYADRLEDGGAVLIYEGHDMPRDQEMTDPKLSDQPMTTTRGMLTQNGKFYQAAMRYKADHGSPDLVRVYEKLKPGIWVFNGTFALTDAWMEEVGRRAVFKFRLELRDEVTVVSSVDAVILPHTRLIPSSVKLEVWRRDQGRCVRCGSTDNLHFDHIIPYSRGGTSLVADNIQLLCARHNLEKHDKLA